MASKTFREREVILVSEKLLGEENLECSPLGEPGKSWLSSPARPGESCGMNRTVHTCGQGVFRRIHRTGQAKGCVEKVN